MDLGLQDKVIVVSGGAAGIGEAISRACLDEGARVVAITRMSPKIESLLTEMKTKGVSFRLIEAELADWKQCKAAIDDVLSVEGRIDGLVNNAGANDGVGLASGDPERFMESLRQNLLHCYALAHDALPALKEPQGSIVNISSKVAITGQGGTSAYAAAKGAQLALTREWAAELLPFNIRVNCILPAEVMTPLYRKWLDTVEDPEAKLKEIVRHIPFGHRMTTAAEIASMAVFLLSNKQSGHTTGQNLVVDGGYVHLDRSLT